MLAKVGDWITLAANRTGGRSRRSSPTARAR